MILLVRHHDRIVSKEQVFAEIWRDRVVSDAALSSRIKSVRKLLGDDGSRQAFVRTVYGRGFRFVANVHTDQPVDQSRPIDGPPPTHYARSGDLHIAYQVFGQGSHDLVMVPGFISHIDNYWDDPLCSAYLQRLGQFARVAVFDKRGTGLSDRVPHLPHMDERMEDVRVVLDAAGFDRAVIMGISEGGSLASMFAAHHPERCQALVLYGAFARFSSWFPTPESLESLFDYIRSEWGSGNSLPAFAPSMSDDYRHWWGKFERLGANPNAAIELMRMNSEIDISGILHAIQTPTLVIHRSEDVLIEPAAGDFLAQSIPGARLFSLPGEDHLPWVGANTVEITDAIAEFVGGIAPHETADRVLATVVAVCIEGTSIAVSQVTDLAAKHKARRTNSHRNETLAAFDGPARALLFAVAVRSLAEGAKIGVHTGEVIYSSVSAEGPAVELARDLMKIAVADSVLVSRTVTDLVAGSGIVFRESDIRLDKAPSDWRLYTMQ